MTAEVHPTSGSPRSAPTPTGTPTPSAKPGRLFHAIAAIVFVACVLVGFREFYFSGRAYPGREITPPIRGLVIAHGVSMALWLLVLAVQTFLVAARNVKAHMALGKFGALVALAIVPLGWKVGIESARVAPPGFQLHGLGPIEFMAVPVLGVTMFGAFVAAGIALRKRPTAHRAAMAVGTLSALPAALDRIDAVTQPLVGSLPHAILGPFTVAALVGAALLALRCAMIRAFDRPWAVALACFVAASAGIFALAKTVAWASFAHALLGA